MGEEERLPGLVFREEEHRLHQRIEILDVEVVVIEDALRGVVRLGRRVLIDEVDRIGQCALHVVECCLRRRVGDAYTVEELGCLLE